MLILSFERADMTPLVIMELREGGNPVDAIDQGQNLHCGLRSHLPRLEYLDSNRTRRSPENTLPMHSWQRSTPVRVTRHIRRRVGEGPASRKLERTADPRLFGQASGVNRRC